MPELNPQPLPPRVRIHVPSDVLFSLDKMHKVTASVLGKLGCGGCHSGRILEFLAIDEFIVNAKLEVNEVVGGLREF